MSETLFPYYERELLFIRQMSQEFARQFPGSASRLLLEPNRSVDPHVERMIQAFALLTARIQFKLDDEFPELSESLLNILYPHYLAPIPSMAIVEFALDSQRGPLPNGFHIPRHSQLRTQPVNDVICRYRTNYPVNLWPIAVQQAQLLPPPFPPGLRPPPTTQALLILRLDCQAGLKFSDLSLDRLRFYFNGESQVIANLYELLFHHTLQVLVRPVEPDTKPQPLMLAPGQSIFPVGFEPDENLIPYPKRSFPGYRLLTEYFTFPYKFHFFDLGGFQRVKQAGFGKKIEVVFFLNRQAPSLQQAIDANTFRLGCTPAINLFERPAEPISLTQTKSEYLIQPDISLPFGLEVYGIESVTSIEPSTGKTSDCLPFYSIKHGISMDEPPMFYYASRRPSTREQDKGTDVYLHLVDMNFKPSQPSNQTLALRVTCTNRHMPTSLQRFADNLRIELEGAAPLASLKCLRRPTMPLAPPARRNMHWRLISHLALNHLSITGGEEGKDVLQEILRLYDFSNVEVNDQQAAITRNLIDGIVSVGHRRVVGRVGQRGIAQGVEIDVEFDEQKYVGSGVYLFASILERFFGAYATLNSFTQLSARLSQTEGIFKKWPPRSGWKPLV